MTDIIKRINELSKKSKSEGLNDAEKAEQQALRAEYVKGFRDDLARTLDNTVLMDEKGNKTPLKRNNQVDL